jgi:hypothetical protein
MTARILRVELRRSNARWMALLLLPAAITFGEAGRGLTVAALDHRQALFAALPLAMGVAAWHARRDRMDELLATTARPRWQRVLPAAAALAIGALAGYLAAVAVIVGLVVAAGGYLSAVALPIIAVGALVPLVGVSFGLALGRWLPFVLVPPPGCSTRSPRRRRTRPTRRCSSRARPCPSTRRCASCRRTSSGPGSPNCARPSWPAAAATGWIS